MKRYQELLDEIISILSDHSRGLGLQEISDYLGKNRNTVSKYLDVLLAQGRIQMKRYGPAKVFFLTAGIPVTSLIHYSSDCIFVLDRHFKILNINESAKNHVCTGNNHDTLVGEDFFNVVNLPTLRVDNQQFSDLLYQALDGKFFEFPAIYVGKKLRNSMRHINLRLYPAILKDGGMGIAVVIQNVTNEIANKEKAIRAEEKLSRVLNALRDPVVMINRDYKIIMANEPFKHLINDAIEGKKCYKTFYGRDSPCSPCFMQQVFAEKKILQVKTGFTTSQGDKKFFTSRAGIAEKTPDGRPQAIVNILSTFPSSLGEEDITR
jgi:PAS domain-containing protein